VVWSWQKCAARLYARLAREVRYKVTKKDIVNVARYFYYKTVCISS
jgi:hypothetical protein